MKILTKSLFASMGLLTLGFTTGHAQSNGEDPVLNLLVRKGLVSQADADQAKAEEKQEADKKPSNIVLKDPSVQKLEFYGDGRLRFENIDQHNEYNAITLYDRERYRLRFGADYTYSDHLKAGFELESASTDDTANQTFGGTFTKSSINVGKIYLQYAPTDWLTLDAGKFTNPWYTTSDIVYSNDLNPEGGAELFSYTFPLSGGTSRVSDPKDVKSVAVSSNSSPDSFLTVGLTSVQYIYVDSNEGTATLGANLNNNDVFIIGNQIPITWKINKDVLVKVAPGFTFYTGGGNTNYDGGVGTNTGSSIPSSTPAVPGTFFASANSSVDPVFYSTREADHLAILSAPGEFNFNVASIPFRPYWDFEYNTDAKARVQNVYLEPGTFGGYSTGVTAAHAAQNKDLSDGIAWSAGLQIGVNKKKGDWSGLVEYRQIGLGAVDQNINGTDYADSYANQQGVKLSSTYNFTDFLTLTATFYDTWAYKSGLYKSLGGTGASPSAVTSSTLNLVGEKSDQRVQVDLGWKF